MTGRGDRGIGHSCRPSSGQQRLRTRRQRARGALMGTPQGQAAGIRAGGPEGGGGTAGHQARDKSDPEVQVSLSGAAFESRTCLVGRPWEGTVSLRPLTICRPERGLSSLIRRNHLRGHFLLIRDQSQVPLAGGPLLSSCFRVPGSRLTPSRATARGNLWAPGGGRTSELGSC